jgi:putative radical SAM enzyme (TIGR03279 family)
MAEHIINGVSDNSIAKRLGIVPGDTLVALNGEEIEDIFDYQYHCENMSVDIRVRHSDDSFQDYHVEKDEDEDIGLTFDEGLMDNYRHCSNKCIFCFIDQLPPGMRDTLYFKDDDARLSFLQGNYITLTNMSDHDIDRIIKYRLQPINISFQTMNPQLRCKMLNNRFAGDALKKVDRLFEAGLKLNGQIVLCKGVNDGDELEYSLSELYKYVPQLESLSVVPVGLSKYREGLYPLEPFDADDAIEVISIIERWQQRAYAEYGTHFVHASDEWYISAGMDLPDEESYDGYLQIENGVGMMRSLIEEFKAALDDVKNGIDIHDMCVSDRTFEGGSSQIAQTLKRLLPFLAGKRAERLRPEKMVVVTGMLAHTIIEDLAEQAQEVLGCKEIIVLPVTNHFFGEKITVTGLLTGQDIIAACKEYAADNGGLGDRIILPENILRSGTDVLLDDVTVAEISDALQVRVDIVKSSGYDMLDCFMYPRNQGGRLSDSK